LKEKRTVIEGVRLLELPSFEDDRGRLVQIFEEAKDLPRARRMYAVKNWDKNTVRAFHKNFSENKIFFAVSGAIQFILVDDRPGSPTYRQKEKIILSSEKPAILVVPAEVHNGWKALTDDALLIGIADTIMADHKDERVPPSSFGAEWK
jgi:dTDP-4-dehydrorhamnose 3,5-epimerase-like enzyme